MKLIFKNLVNEMLDMLCYYNKISMMHILFTVNQEVLRIVYITHVVIYSVSQSTQS